MVLKIRFSPLTWGCPWLRTQDLQCIAVFPAHVGMFRRELYVVGTDGRFPLSRGDVPLSIAESDADTGFSTLMWRCSGKLADYSLFN